MQFTTITTLCLLTVVTSTPIQKRQSASAVESDIQNIASEISTFNSDVAAFNGDILGALEVDVAGENLDTAITDTTSDTESSAAFAAADATTITNAVTALTPSIESSLNAVVAKEPQFDSLGLDPTVSGQLNTLKSDTAALATALEAKVGTTNAATITSNAATIESAFASAIAAFS